MWECKNCGFKNNSNNLKCHGTNCKGSRDEQAIKLPEKIVQQKAIIKNKKLGKVYDFCPRCLKDRIWVQSKHRGKRCWKCLECGSKAWLIGKSKAFPEEIKIESEIIN